MKVKSMNTTAKILGLLFLISIVAAEDPYRFFEWHVTYGNISPLGVSQQVLYLLTLIPPNYISLIWVLLILFKFV